MDFGTVVQRRASKEPIDKGGRSMFCASFPAVDYLDPLAAPSARGNGLKAWFGWPDDPKLESLHVSWMDATDPAERKNVTGFLKGPVPIFWNVVKA